MSKSLPRYLCLPLSDKHNGFAVYQVASMGIGKMSSYSTVIISLSEDTQLKSVLAQLTLLTRQSFYAFTDDFELSTSEKIINLQL